MNYNNLIFYLLEVTLITLVLIIPYYLGLQNTGQLHFKRWYLILGLAGSLVAPWLNIEVLPANLNLSTAAQNSPVTAGITMPMPLLPYVAEPLQPVLRMPGIASGTSWPVNEGLFYLYLGGLLISGLHLLISLFRLYRWRRQATPVQGKVNTFFHPDFVLPSTFGPWIFWPSRKVLPHENAVYLHEKTHVTEGHSWDLLFLQVVKTMLWFNPVLIWWRTAMTLNHELLADRVAQRTLSPEAYIRLLLQYREKQQRMVLVSTIKSMLAERIKFIHQPLKIKPMQHQFLFLAATLVLVIFCTAWQPANRWEQTLQRPLWGNSSTTNEPTVHFTWGNRQFYPQADTYLDINKEPQHHFRFNLLLSHNELQAMVNQPLKIFINNQELKVGTTLAYLNIETDTRRLGDERRFVSSRQTSWSDRVPSSIREAIGALPSGGVLNLNLRLASQEHHHISISFMTYDPETMASYIQWPNRRWPVTQSLQREYPLASPPFRELDNNFQLFQQGQPVKINAIKWMILSATDWEIVHDPQASKLQDPLKAMLIILDENHKNHVLTLDRLLPTAPHLKFSDYKSFTEAQVISGNEEFHIHCLESSMTVLEKPLYLKWNLVNTGFYLSKKQSGFIDLGLKITAEELKNMFNQAPYLEKDGHKLSGPISFDLQHIPHADVPYTRTFIYHPSSQKYTLGQGHIQPLIDQVEPGDFLQLRNIFTPGIDTIRFGYQMKIALKNEPVQERGFLDPRLAGVYMTRGMRYNE